MLIKVQTSRVAETSKKANKTSRVAKTNEDMKGTNRSISSLGYINKFYRKIFVYNLSLVLMLIVDSAVAPFTRASQSA